MDTGLPFYSYSEYLQKKYGTKVYRIAVDGGFSCPNRSCDRAQGGCIYCNELGSRASYLDKAKAIEEQIKRGVAFTRRRYKAELFLLYFQAYSNTFDTVDNLKKTYDAALALYPFRELIVATRPDCIDGAKADLLASYIKPDFDVWVELGLQSANDRTLERIHRGHTAEQYKAAFDILHSRGIKVASHLILGLPGESFDDMLASVDFINALHPEAVKLHDLNITYNTVLYEEYLKGEVTAPSRELYMEYLIKVIEHLRKDIILMRLTCDTYEADRAAPRKYMSKGNIYALLQKEMESRNTWQGRLCTTGK
ncbi:MAG: TIGR01212 family radical SAM protein [Spirochaetia bacterium]|nr:TIGR01212 family radical SAM protein [Spirochaetia bacterium]